jgi:4-diphosphocytidyl-2-C-methyl-D-erythritol kinase
MYVRRSPEAIVVQAPAKLNLHFEVLGRRPDGFHEVETFITAISLFDTLTFFHSSPQTEQAGLQCTVDFAGDWAPGMRGYFHSPAGDSTGDLQTALGDLPEPSDNIVVKAIELLGQRAGTEKSAVVRLVKRIPSSAGLGGGSSDAAAALVAANLAWNLGWSQERLASLAADLGSDVPFYFTRGAAICRGRGDRLESLANSQHFHFVVVRPPQGLSTADVYRNCQPAQTPVSIGPLLEAWRNGCPYRLGSMLMNRLQEPAAKMCSWVGRLQNAMKRLEVPGHQMTGSGSSYFAICHNARHAQHTASRLRAQRLGQVFHATSVHIPLN